MHQRAAGPAACPGAACMMRQRTVHMLDACPTPRPGRQSTPSGTFTCVQEALLPSPTTHAHTTACNLRASKNTLQQYSLVPSAQEGVTMAKAMWGQRRRQHQTAKRHQARSVMHCTCTCKP